MGLSGFERVGDFAKLLLPPEEGLERREVVRDRSGADREDASSQARLMNGGAMRWKIQRRAADHCRELAGLIV
jgi:hypothetical protein